MKLIKKYWKLHKVKVKKINRKSIFARKVAGIIIYYIIIILNAKISQCI